MDVGLSGEIDESVVLDRFDRVCRQIAMSLLDGANRLFQQAMVCCSMTEKSLCSKTIVQKSWNGKKTASRQNKFFVCTREVCNEHELMNAGILNLPFGCFAGVVVVVQGS